MRIAVNTRLLLKGKMEGIGWFSYETLSRITRSHPEIEFIFIFDRKPSTDFIFSENVKAVVAHPQARHPFLWYLFFEFGVKRVLDRYKPDLFLSPDGWLSLRSKVPQLAVIHDLNFEEHPEFIEPLVLRYYRRFFPLYAKKARRIATVSNYTKGDISARYGIDENSIDVVYNGVNELFRPLNEEDVSAIRNRYAKGDPYFLFVGLIHPRKNLKNQLKAFLKMKEETSSNLKYLVVGAKYSWESELDDLLASSIHGKDVIILGRQGLDELVDLYGAAFALTYASYFEGFGIPIVEAMKSGVPVITSNTSSMPEIAGDSGLLVAPDSVDEISIAMKKLWQDKELRERLIAEGMRRAKYFSWDKSANDLFESIQKALN
ncbi:MAG: glycosyltransferase family 1 protein [Bacteroidota bacterium]